MRTIEIRVGNMHIVRTYPESDQIWSLPDEKRERQAVADCQKDLIVEADRLSHTPYQVRG